MKHEMTCPRCGNLEAISQDECNDWDEINCAECGEFITTCDLQLSLASRHYQMHTLSRSLDLLIAMSNDEIVAGSNQQRFEVAA
ncbi:hypothetical protein [Salinicola halophilus]|uniref:hypothetical protein n=1 Tax=Salinicola halophilus TaxID=184065 RepID=UPI000DA1CD29|nr:hypothetical protein [Salinicola halophilus]